MIDHWVPEVVPVGDAARDLEDEVGEDGTEPLAEIRADILGNRRFS